MGFLNYTIAKVNELLGKVANLPEEIKDGKTPVLETGTTTTLSPGSNATSEVVPNGTDIEGNPKYLLNFGIPKGQPGTGGEGGGVSGPVDWTDIENKPAWVNSSVKPTYTASEVGALPSTTVIPSKTTDLTNDSGFTTSSSFKTINGQSIVGTGNIVIESGGGTGGSTGGTGNVSVSNQSTLQTGKRYVFKPSANGSASGTFEAISAATENADGLMTADMYSKLDDMKITSAIPVAVLSLGNSSTSEEILAAMEVSLDGILQSASVFQSIAQMDYNKDFSHTYIGNYEVSVNAEYDSTANTGALEFTYIAKGGVLRTIRIDATSDSCSCTVTESGYNGIYYLPSDILNIREDYTKEQVESAFGGSEAFGDIKTALKEKKIFVIYENNVNIKSLPVVVDYFNFGADYFTFTIDYSGDNVATRSSVKPACRTIHINIGKTSIIHIKTIYKEGYMLSSSLFSISENAESDEISTAVGGESGLKKIITAARDGNRFSLPFSISEYTGYINVNVIGEIKEDGDINMLFIGTGFMLWSSTLGGILNIRYMKSTDTFAATVIPLGLGS